MNKALVDIARQLLACPVDDTQAAIRVALSTAAAATGAVLAAIYVHERDSEQGASEDFWSTSPMEQGFIERLRSEYEKRPGDKVAADYWRFDRASLANTDLANVGLDSSNTDIGFDFGILLPLSVGARFDGFIVFAFAAQVEASLPNYSDLLVVLADMLANTLRRSREVNALKLLKERLRQGQVYANIGIWEWDLVTHNWYCSEQMAPLFGLTPGQSAITGDLLMNAIYPDDRNNARRVVEEAVAFGIAYDVEYRVVWPDGSIRWVRARGGLIRNDAHNTRKVLGTIQDINDQKTAQLILKDREHELTQVQELAKLGSFQVDLKTGASRVSDQIYDIYGLDKNTDRISIETGEDTIHPDDKELFQDAQRKFMRTGRYESTHRILRPSGEVRYVHMLGQGIQLAEGKPTSIIGAVQDITDLVKLEEHLRESERRFTFAIEGAGDAIWDWNQVTNEIDYSGLSKNFLGYERDELPSQIEVLSGLLHADDRPALNEAHQRCVRGETDTYKQELRMRCKDGSYKWILCRASVVERDDQGRAVRVIGIHSDISDSKANEAELIAARDEAERANRAKSEFLSHMSHELRTPMNAILGFGQLLQQDESLSKANADKVSEILNAGNHLLNLINEVLDLAKVEAGKVALSVESVLVAEVLADVVGLLDPLAIKKRVEIFFSEIDQVAVFADRMRLKQVLINLLSNAIKYNRTGGRVTISVQCGDRNTVRIAVEDTGIGIEPDALEEIFHPFNRHRADSSGVEGTGIGLTLTKALVELMNGKVGVYSVSGGGSLFWVELPLAARDEMKELSRVESDDKQFHYSQGERKTVLYIDDNPVNLKLVKHIFASIPNVTLVEAHSGELGINIAQALQPDLLLVDINMPGIDGYQVLSILKRKPAFANKPFVAVTANAMASDVARGKAAGFSEYLSKPFNIAEFKSLMYRLLQ